MAEIQHRDAPKLLNLIDSSLGSGSQLTYSEVARRLGRNPETDSRAVAQICDLLDAAACYAGTPLLALIAVRDSEGQINSQAWVKEYGPGRDAIIRRSQQHRFTGTDILQIRSSLVALTGLGNRKAWKLLEKLYPMDLLYRRLTGNYAIAQDNAINDLGADSGGRTLSSSWTYVRDPDVRNAVLQRAKCVCEYCGKQGFLKKDGTRYLESHHVIALAEEGADRMTNVVALCPDDHRKAHFGTMADEMEREMITFLRAV